MVGVEQRQEAVDCSSAIGTDRYRVYWLIFVRPYSPSRWSACSDGTTPVISCMMIEALMYGFHAERHDREARQATTREQVEQPEIGLPFRKFVSSARLTPGTGTWARSRKMNRIPATYRIRRRRSGARNELSRASNTGA